LKLTPIDIKKQEFKRGLRGYDPDEVRAYLEFVADEYEQLLQYNTQLEKQVASYQTELRHYKEVEKTLKQTLHELQETSKLSKQTSQKEADLIKREAQLKASKMVEEAKTEVEKIRKELADLQQQKNSLVTRLRYLLLSQLELLDVLQTDDSDLDDIKEKTQKLFKGSRRSSHASKRQPSPASAAGEKEKEASARPAKAEPEIRMPKAEQPVKNAKSAPKPSAKEQKKSKDFFKDIFGDDLSVDDIFKEKEE